LSTPRLEIHLDRLHHNALTLVTRLARRGIAITAVSKAILGLPEIVHTWAAAGVSSIGDARVETLEALARQGITLPMVLIRAPLLSQVDRVVAVAGISLNSEPETIRRLAAAAQRQGRRHGVVLMVELGDRREGLLPRDLDAAAALTLQCPALELVGLGTNLGCQHGVVPDGINMAALSALAVGLEARFRIHLGLVSGGNSANLSWLEHAQTTGRINHLRLGEALLLGREPLARRPIASLHTNAFQLVAEVIEARVKPSRPLGERGRTSFDQIPLLEADAGEHQRALLAIGIQDVDPAGLRPPAGLRILGASSDHLVVERPAKPLELGEEVTFGLDYSALLRAMTSPFVQRHFCAGTEPTRPTGPLSQVTPRSPGAALTREAALHRRRAAATPS